MEYFALSKSYDFGAWSVESGGGTFIDSYSLRSYTLFSNITHESYQWGILKPILGLNCYYKGVEYSSDDMHFLCHPSLKLRVWYEEGLFMNIMPIPPAGDLTNGFVTIEFGYKF